MVGVVCEAGANWYDAQVVMGVGEVAKRDQRIRIDAVVGEEW